MPVTYDPAKSERNEAERGLAFSLAEEFHWSTALVVEDMRKEYEERRYQALGMIGEHLHMLVFTPRDGCGACDQPAQSKPTRKDALCHAS